MSRVRNRMSAWLLLGALLSLPAVSPAEPQLSEPRKAELRHLLKQDCGSCHGLTMRGGLGPPITPQALAERDRETMVATVLYGRPGTPMPPWSTILTEDEARWLVDLLYEGDIR
ncbi:c-type cytochrome [Thioalkalivibrio thiocyanodenitrificans]|uniref:c-type cytochrome n=1 Tax=Thioalkalivibrio thiocyanodenitrificans TaxID=243063 RepID=UPI0022B39290|nr:cytochrome c [Thioalkalivibrio thiocyanodenitrificans]